MATKTLIRTGTSLATRLLNSPLTHSASPSSNHRYLLSSSTRFLSPPLFSPQNAAFSSPNPPFSFPIGEQNKVEEVNKTLDIVKDFFPFGVPNLDFFLPDANDTLDEPMILFPKRPFQPSTLRRKRNHGFFARKATKGGRRVIVRRIAKGRHRITA